MPKTGRRNYGFQIGMSTRERETLRSLANRFDTSEAEAVRRAVAEMHSIYEARDRDAAPQPEPDTKAVDLEALEFLAFVQRRLTEFDPANHGQCRWHWIEFGQVRDAGLGRGLCGECYMNFRRKQPLHLQAFPKLKVGRPRGVRVRRRAA